jgi:NAD(P)-dependent dehydrogenase (short-subunit alcohol dehydrogenase family)
MGYRVYVGSRNLSNGEKAAAEIGTNAYAIQMDVTQQPTIKAAEARIEKEQGRLDLLVNNAAIGSFSMLQARRIVVDNANIKYTFCKRFY